nr:alpha/beta hydrolase [Actinomadura rayongensis]
MNAYPEKIGWLDGIPSEDRNEANRTRLAARINQLEEKGNNLTRYQHRDLERLLKLRDAISTYESKGQDVYLLGLDSTITTQSEYDKGDGSDGRAIVAFGNPDTAKHTGVYVPGTTENLDKFTGSMNRAFNLNQATSQLTGGPVSTIAWLGYDAPNNVFDHLLPGDAAVPGYAIRGGAQLNSFVDGLRVAQNDAGDAGSHLTLVGHSYGSTVIGEAAKQHDGRLPVDDIVVAGSPGMHVAHAGDLGIGAGHVWAEKAPGDPVPLAGKVFHGGWTLHGPQVPSDEGFGANRLDTDGHGHGEYWRDNDITGREDRDPYTFRDPGLSLRQQAKVIAGTYGDQDPINNPTLVNN